LNARARRDIGQTLALKKLPKHTAEVIEWAVNCCHTTKSGSTSTTVANTLLALRNLEKRGRAREEALALLADDHAGVDYTTLNALQSLAKATLEGRSRANEALIEAARKRAAELADHPRVTIAREPMRYFCGVLRTIFDSSSANLKGKITQKEAWRRCRQFALAILTAASIDHADFDAHPERLIEYLGTDVSAD
jgi:hypothetical protein